MTKPILSRPVWENTYQDNENLKNELQACTEEIRNLRREVWEMELKMFDKEAEINKLLVEIEALRKKLN